jgi:hypothetical protein
MISQKDIEKVLTSKLEWIRLSDIYNPVSKRMENLVNEHGNSGVYQVCTTADKSEEILFANLGYIGESKSIFGRTYCLKINKHNACNYIKHNNIDISDIWVRYFFTSPEDRQPLERLMHETMEKQYGYRFKWREASAGTDGSLLRLYEMIDKLNSREDAETVYRYVRERCVELYLDNLDNNTEGE